LEDFLTGAESFEVTFLETSAVSEALELALSAALTAPLTAASVLEEAASIASFALSAA
jgi:hypothetical protein